MAERVVTKVRPKRNLQSFPELILQKRVAAYARVSSDSEEQLNSVEAQKDYFEKLIKERPEWIFAGVYADEGISGTTLNKRVAFNKMIEDAMNGEIDLIVTKSLSRFARNTVDALNVIRKLKSANVGVYFEKEDIDTLDAKGEFLITLMSSLAEEESRSMSENVKWGHHKRFAEGKYSLPYARFLGYKKGADGCPELVEEEAKIIRIIYRLFFEGYSTTSIAKKLTNANILTPGKQTNWQRQTIKSILRNEKYYGAALLQKTYSADYRGRITKRNRGELPMYYIENDHEGIVTKEVYDAVQERLNREHRLPVTTTVFAGKLYCSDCGGLYGRLPFHSTTYNGELLITIMSSLAQEESRSISENVTWGQRKRFADGKVSLPYRRFLGYRKGEDGLPEIVPEEAAVVRDIYRMFISGKSVSAIAKILTENKVATPGGKEKWQRQTVGSILTNEKYKGAALLQKRFTVDFLQKKMKVNEGEVPQYYVENSHPAIIEPEEWERVQLELARRRDSGRRTLCQSPFAGKIICGDCGDIYGAKVWHSNNKYRRTIWQCNNKFKGDKKCTTGHLYEDDIKDSFVTALSTLLSDREELLKDSRIILAELDDNTAIDTECDNLIEEMDMLSAHIQKCVVDNAIQVADQDEYIRRYNSLVERYEKLQSRYDYLQKKKERRLIQADRLSGFMFAVKELDLLQLEFNEKLWQMTVENVTVHDDGRLVWRFRNGCAITV